MCYKQGCGRRACWQPAGSGADWCETAEAEPENDARDKLHRKKEGGGEEEVGKLKGEELTGEVEVKVPAGKKHKACRKHKGPDYVSVGASGFFGGGYPGSKVQGGGVRGGVVGTNGGRCLRVEVGLGRVRDVSALRECVLSLWLSRCVCLLVSSPAPRGRCTCITVASASGAVSGRAAPGSCPTRHAPLPRTRVP